MADKRVQDLEPVDQVYDNDSFVLEQNKKARRLTGSKLIRYLITACDKLGILGVHVGPDEPKENQNVWIKEVEDYEVPDESFALFDSRYPKKSEVPSKTSQLTNDSGFITADDVPASFDDTQVSKEKGWTSSKIAQSVAPALTRTISGEVIAVDDVSPLEHNVGCKVESLNVFDFDVIVWNSETNVENNVVKLPTKTGSYDVFNFPSNPLSSQHFSYGKTYTFKAKRVGGKPDTPYSLALTTVSNSYDYVNLFSDLYLTNEGTVYSKTFVFNADVSDNYGWYLSVADMYDSGFDLYIQIEEGDTTGIDTSFTPYIPDLSAMTVQVHGDNVLQWPYKDLNVIEGVTAKVTDDGFVEFNGTSTNSASYYFSYGNRHSPTQGTAGRYYYKIEVEGAVSRPEVNPIFINEYKNSHYVSNLVHTAYSKKGTFDITSSQCDFLVSVNGAPGLTFTNYRVRVMISKNPITEYVRGDYTEYVPNSDGIVSGMTSLSPSMTILTDTPGALLDVTYNADPMTIIDKLTQRVADLESATAQI